MTKIHIIDDDLDLLDTYCDILTSVGYDVAVDYDGGKALQTLANFKPDIVTLDQQLPRVSGPLLMTVLRRYQKQYNTKVIIISGHEQDARTREADRYLEKPVSATVLRATISDLIDEETDLVNCY